MSVCGLVLVQLCFLYMCECILCCALLLFCEIVCPVYVCILLFVLVFVCVRVCECVYVKLLVVYAHMACQNGHLCPFASENGTKTSPANLA